MLTARIVAVLGTVCAVASLLFMPHVPALHAQDPGEERRSREEVTPPAPDEAGQEGRVREVESAAHVSGEGLNDPPPDGLSVRYMFTGARHETTAGREVATVVHCTNYGDDDASVRVEIYDWDDYDNFTFSGSMTVDRNHTATFVTQSTNVYSTDVLMTQTSADGINQGSGRVMSDQSTLICTVQVIDPSHYVPLFATRLPLYYPDGTQVNVHGMRVIQLPVILRHYSD